jgi:hypothetical protein
MPTLCKTYPDEGRAREAVRRLLASGVPDREVRLLEGSRPHDIRREPVGTFLGTIEPDAPVGTFAGETRLRRQGHGSFAGDPDRQRKGSFADVDRDVIVTFGVPSEQARVVTRRALQRLLRPVTAEGEPSDMLVEELHEGHKLVLAEVPESRG